MPLLIADSALITSSKSFTPYNSAAIKLTAVSQPSGAKTCISANFPTKVEAFVTFHDLAAKL